MSIFGFLTRIGRVVRAALKLTALVPAPLLGIFGIYGVIRYFTRRR